MDTLQLILFHFQEKNSEEALRIIENSLSNASEEEKYHIAYLLIEFGFIERAEEILTDLLEENQNNSDVKSLLADIYIERMEDEKAIQLLHSIDPGDENYLTSLIQLADLYQSQGLVEVAELKLLEAKQLSPSELLIDFALGELYFSSGAFNEAIPCYEKIIEEKDTIGDVSIQTRLAESYASIGEYEKALAQFEEIDTTDPDLLFKHGLTAFHIKEYQKAIVKWKELIEIDPFYYVVYYYLGEAYLSEGMLSEAKEIVEEGIKYDEHNDNLYFLAANISLKQRELDMSKQFIEQALQLNPEHHEYIMFYVNLLRQSFEEERVIKLLKKALKEYVYEPKYEWEIAKSYYELDQLEEALRYYEEAYKTFYDTAPFLREFGYFLIEYGEFERGKEMLNKYLQLEPFDEDTKEYLERLE